MSEAVSGKTILVGISGGVAAYKALDVVSALRQRGHTVQVVLTEAATHFIQPALCSAVSGQPALTDMWAESPAQLEAGYPHLYPSTRTDLFVLLPATANTMAKLAGGFGSDLLSTCCLSLPETCHKLFCPSMNVEMWRNAAVQRNVRRLEADGWLRVGPAEGHLACGMTGAGRLSEPADILAEIDRLLNAKGSLSGKVVLITSGPTQEHLDPVRYLGNSSSGKMGKALAEEALRRGARVIFITGPVPEANLPRHPNLDCVRVTAATEMLEAAKARLEGATHIVCAAAVADFRPEQFSTEKLPKSDTPPALSLVPNPDVAATLNAEKAEGVFSVVFALQSEEGEERARQKLEAKHANGVVLNYTDSMGGSDGDFSWLAKDDSAFTCWSRIDKTEAARRIIDQLPT